MLHGFVGEELPDGMCAGDDGSDDGQEEQGLVLPEVVGALRDGQGDEGEVRDEAGLEAGDEGFCFGGGEKAAVDDVGDAF